jgi:signal transduction histidine kinase/CheY-like chemotaxis protein
MLRMGMQHANTRTEQLRLVIVNTMTLGGMMVSVSLALIYLSLGHYLSLWVALIAFSASVFTGYCVSRGHTAWVLVMLLAFNIIIFVQHQIFQGAVPNYLFFIVMATAPFVIFPPKHQLLAMIAAGTAFILWLVSIYFPNILFRSEAPIAQDLAERVSLIVWVAAFAFALVPALLLFTLIQRYEGELLANQEERIHTAKLVSLGELAAGIAHEINNPLGVVCGKAEALLERLAEEGSLTEATALASLETIQRNGHLIHKIVTSLRTLARQSSRDPMVSCQVDDVIAATLELVRQRITDLGIQLSVDTAKNLKIRCRPSEVMQILTNILTNARDALEDSPVRPKLITIHAAKVGDRAAIRIANNGPIIDAGVRDRIFDPFFTTKAPNRGTGLGLSISAVLARAHSGSLSVTSEATWTAFTLTLSEMKKILLIDDNVEMHSVVLDALKPPAYELVFCADPFAAPALVAATVFDLILCDIKMPGVSGLILIDELKKQGPIPPFIFVTGEMSEEAARESLRLRAAGVIEKPFRLRQLREIVAKVLQP